MHDESEPRLLGPYVLLLPLAQGGMGSIHLAAAAADHNDDALCIVKVLKPGLAAGSDYLPRFVDEARIAVLLQHPNLCRVFDAGFADGELFLAMEHIDGVTFKRLSELCRKREQPLPTLEAVALAIAMLDGLDGAHKAIAKSTGQPLGVVHRDVSPHNVMVDIHGAVKVIDFGLATSVLKETVTEGAVVLGKSAYMAPEQARGEDTGPAVDQYAAAIVLYELLVDDRYYGDLPSRAIWSIVGAGNHRPRAWDKVPPALAPLLKRALSANPDDRFADCGAFARALAAAYPTATTTAVRVQLGQRVRGLQPSELRRRDHAIEILHALPPGLIQRAPEATERVRARVSADDDTVVRGVVKPSRPTEDSIDESGRTATSRALVPPSPQRGISAVAAGVAALGLAAAVTLFAVAGPSLGTLLATAPTAPTTTAPTTTAPTTTAPTTPPTTAPTTTAPTTVTTTVVASTVVASTLEPETPAPKEPPPPPPPPKKLKLSAATLKARAQKIAHCQAPTCPALIGLVGGIKSDATIEALRVADQSLKQCEAACSLEP